MRRDQLDMHREHRGYGVPSVPQVWREISAIHDENLAERGVCEAQVGEVGRFY